MAPPLLVGLFAVILFGAGFTVKIPRTGLGSRPGREAAQASAPSVTQA